MTNPTPADWRALCAELLQELCCHYRSWELKEGHCSDAVTRARAALAQPEPQGPTDEELDELWSRVINLKIKSNEIGPRFPFARAVLQRWGRPAFEPVPVAERLPGWRDCDKNDCVWVEEPDRYVLRPIEKSDIRQNRRWLPHHALPVPQQEAE